jgi:hypothetical protein
MRNSQANQNTNALFTVFTFLLKNISKKIKAGSLKKLSDYIFIVIEKIVVKFQSFLSAYILYYEDIVDNEIQLAQITSHDTVLHIGCGSLPSTSLLIAQKTRARTTAIDKNPSSVQDAQKCVVQLRQEDQIQIHHANALDYPMDSADAIIVSQGIEPRYEVLTHIADTMNPDARVLFRTFSSEQGGITPQDEVLSKLFIVKKTVLHPEHGLLMSILLKKKQ